MKKFETPEIEAIVFAVEDVITTSDTGSGLAQELGLCTPDL